MVECALSRVGAAFASLLASTLLGCGMALAQAPDPAAARRIALRSLPEVCADETRLCPDPGYGTLDANALLLCLKDHTIDVSLACRHVVAQAQR